MRAASRTGSNKFRSWKDERVVWYLGRRGAEWKIDSMTILEFSFRRADAGERAAAPQSSRPESKARSPLRGQTNGAGIEA